MPVSAAEQLLRGIKQEIKKLATMVANKQELYEITCQLISTEIMAYMQLRLNQASKQRLMPDPSWALSQGNMLRFIDTLTKEAWEAKAIAPTSANISIRAVIALINKHYPRVWQDKAALSQARQKAINICLEEIDQIKPKPFETSNQQISNKIFELLATCLTFTQAIENPDPKKFIPYQLDRIDTMTNSVKPSLDELAGESRHSNKTKIIKLFQYQLARLTKILAPKQKKIDIAPAVKAVAAAAAPALRKPRRRRRKKNLLTCLAETLSKEPYIQSATKDEHQTVTITTTQDETIAIQLTGQHPKEVVQLTIAPGSEPITIAIDRNQTGNNACTAEYITKSIASERRVSSALIQIIQPPPLSLTRRHALQQLQTQLSELIALLSIPNLSTTTKSRLSTAEAHIQQQINQLIEARLARFNRVRDMLTPELTLKAAANRNSVCYRIFNRPEVHVEFSDPADLLQQLEQLELLACDLKHRKTPPTAISYQLSSLHHWVKELVKTSVNKDSSITIQLPQLKKTWLIPAETPFVQLNEISRVTQAISDLFLGLSKQLVLRQINLAEQQLRFTPNQFNGIQSARETDHRFLCRILLVANRAQAQVYVKGGFGLRTLTKLIPASRIEASDLDLHIVATNKPGQLAKFCQEIQQLGFEQKSLPYLHSPQPGGHPCITHNYGSQPGKTGCAFDLSISDQPLMDYLQDASHQSTMGVLVEIQLTRIVGRVIEIIQAHTWQHPKADSPTAIACVSESYTCSLHSPAQLLRATIHLIKTTMASLGKYPNCIKPTVNLFLQRLFVHQPASAKQVWPILSQQTPRYARLALFHNHFKQVLPPQTDKPGRLALRSRL